MIFSELCWSCYHCFMWSVNKITSVVLISLYTMVGGVTFSRYKMESGETIFMYQVVGGVLFSLNPMVGGVTFSLYKMEGGDTFLMYQVVGGVSFFNSFFRLLTAVSSCEHLLDFNQSWTS